MKLEKMQALYQQLSQQVQEVPVSGSRPLIIAGKIAGFIHPAAISALQTKHYLKQDALAVYLAEAGIARSELNALLVDVAYCLRDAGLTRAWRNELLNVYAEGSVIAQIERAAMRPLGLLTMAIHLNGWTPEGDIYLQLRAASKAFDPNRWDTLVGGLLNAEDSPPEGLIRESQEEAGLATTHLKQRTPIRTILRMRRRLPEGYQLEDILVSDCIIPPDATLENQDGEVERIETFRPSEVIQMIEDKDITIEAAIVLLDSLINQHIRHLMQQ
ncbi:NUDIX hydrolase [Oligella urethralis]|uniref:NUDIX hydrolase n=1 Tax=Oligella urethralis TaxID=90245 RepID=UPI000CFE5B9A|nr:NUDIX domain-containing protein [Oligella urethralis]AVL71798.1 NUDIX hydrolase [Oligella urethralis]